MADDHAPQRLVVWSEGARVGELSVHQGAWAFRYERDWWEAPASFPLSPGFPLGETSFKDTSDERRVQWFFDNLLPEGSVRQALARHARLDEQDAFGLLARFGEESAGALTLLPPGAPYPLQATYDELPREELRARIHELPHVPFLAAGGRGHMSLAGAQHKLPVHRRGRDFLLPRQGASSAIIKPDNARPETFPFCPANEHFCMSVAAAVGLPVPKTELDHLPEPIYIVDRYDRFASEGVVRRRHQIDLCQLLGKWPGYKYQSDGGVTFPIAYEALSATRQPAVSRKQLLDWLVFNYVIGNSDAHAKNISFLVTSEGVDLAPAYDLLCVRACGVDYDYMAMTIAEEVRYGWVERREWDALAGSLALSPKFLARRRGDLARAIPAAARQVLQREGFTDDERTFLAGVVGIIDQHAALLLATV